MVEPLKRIPQVLRFEALSQWLQAMRFASTEAQAGIAPYNERIAANKRDFEARFGRARVLAALGEWTEAMDELLEIIMRDKEWDGQAARKLYIAILELLTPPKPKADAAAAGKSAGGIELTGKAGKQEDEVTQLLNGYRRRLSMALN